MSRPNSLPLILLTILLPWVSWAVADDRPNILFIYTDDQSYRTVGCYPEAYDWVDTPNIDQLAREGVRFSHAYIGSWCMPSRATLLTGLHQHGIESMRMVGEYPGSDYDPALCRFWPSVFRAHGYTTAQIGKWHTGIDSGFGRDWDHQIVWNRPRHPANSPNYYDNQLISKNGGPPTLTTGYSTDNYTQWAIDFIRGEERPLNKPWYLWLCYGAVHGPFTPADRHLSEYAGVEIPAPPDVYPPRPGKPKYVREMEFWEPGPNGEPVERKVRELGPVGMKDIPGRPLADWTRQYHQGVLAIDEGVGQLMKTLKDTGQDDNTLVVFTSDQGFAWGQKGFKSKVAPYRGTVEAPLIIRPPGAVASQCAGRVIEQPVSGVDLPPTFFSFADIDLPWKMHGFDLSPLFQTEAVDWTHQAMLVHTAKQYGRETDRIPAADDPKLYHGPGIPWYVMLCEGRYKYIRNLVAGETEELYDMDADRDELVNLAQDAANAKLLTRFRAATVDELKRTDARFVENLPPTGTEAAIKDPLSDVPDRSRRPNVIFFLVDDLGWRDLGCYGSEFYETPNIDRFAADSVRFTQAYAACHVCSPTRASIMTGKYPARLHLTDWLPGRKEFPFQKLRNAEIHQHLPGNEITIAESLRAHGYRTAHIGKWHLGEEPNGPTSQGFDLQIPRWNKGWPKAGYHAPFQFDGLPDENNQGEYLTDRLTDEALRFIESSKHQPFFLYLSHFAVHDPIQGREDLVAKYETKRERSGPAQGPAFVLEGNPDDRDPATEEELRDRIDQPEYSAVSVLPERTVKVKQHQDNSQFAAMVESVDESLGRLLDQLERLDLDDETIVILFSDNGGMAAANFGRPSRIVAPDRLDSAFSTSNLPLRGAKGWLYEGGIREPLIIHWPAAGRRGSVCDVPVISTDFYPTILEMVGLPPQPDQHIDGVSLAPLVRGENQIEREAIYWHFPHYSNHGMQSPGGAIRAGDFKLLEYFENGSVQLFDLKNDIGEHNDLSQSRPEVTAQLRAMLTTWRQSVGAKMMPPNPDFDPSATVR